MLNIVGFWATACEFLSTVASVSLMHRPQGVVALGTDDFVCLTCNVLFAMEMNCGSGSEFLSTVASVSLMHRPQGDDLFGTDDFVFRFGR